MDETNAARDTAVRLVHVAEQLKADYADAVAPFGLSVPASRALLLLDDPAPMRVLADRLSCDQSYITRIADELENGGFIQRSPGADRRVQILHLTRAGAKMRDAIFRAVTANNRVELRLSPAERVALEKSLDRLLAD